MVYKLNTEGVDVEGNKYIFRFIPEYVGTSQELVKVFLCGKHVDNIPVHSETRDYYREMKHYRKMILALEYAGAVVLVFDETSRSTPERERLEAERIAATSCEWANPCREGRQFEIWSEGYCASGDSGTASYHATVVAKTFEEACEHYAEQNVEFRSYFNRETMTYWGCRLYDTRSQVAASLG